MISISSYIINKFFYCLSFELHKTTWKWLFFEVCVIATITRIHSTFAFLQLRSCVQTLMAFLHTNMIFVILTQTLLTNTFTELLWLCLALKTESSLANLTIIDIKFINVEGWLSTLRTVTKTTKYVTTVINTDYLHTHRAFEFFRLFSRIVTFQTGDSLALWTDNIIMRIIDVPLTTILLNYRWRNMRSIICWVSQTLSTDIGIIPVQAIKFTKKIITNMAGNLLGEQTWLHFRTRLRIIL